MIIIWLKVNAIWYVLMSKLEDTDSVWVLRLPALMPTAAMTIPMSTWAVPLRKDPLDKVDDIISPYCNRTDTYSEWFFLDESPNGSKI